MLHLLQSSLSKRTPAESAALCGGGWTACAWVVHSPASRRAIELFHPTMVVEPSLFGSFSRFLFVLFSILVWFFLSFLFLSSLPSSLLCSITICSPCSLPCRLSAGWRSVVACPHDLLELQGGWRSCEAGLLSREGKKHKQPDISCVRGETRKQNHTQR